MWVFLPFALRLYSIVRTARAQLAGFGDTALFTLFLSVWLTTVSTRNPVAFSSARVIFFVHSTRYTIIQEFIEVFKSRTVRLDFISRRKTCRASDAPLGMIFPQRGHSSQTFEMTCLFGCIHEQFLTILKWVLQSLILVFDSDNLSQKILFNSTIVMHPMINHPSHQIFGVV